MLEIEISSQQNFKNSYYISFPIFRRIYLSYDVLYDLHCNVFPAMPAIDETARIVRSKLLTTRVQAFGYREVGAILVFPSCEHLIAVETGCDEY